MIGPAKVLFLIPHLREGGAARVTALLAQSLSAEKYEVHVGRITEEPEAPHPLPARVIVHSLAASRVRSGTFRLLRLVRRLKPELIFSSMAHLNFLVLLLRPFYSKRTVVLVRQNGTASATLNSQGLPFYTERFYRTLYRHAERVVCQTEVMAEDMAVRFEVPRDRLAVLPNPVDVEEIRKETAGAASLWDGPGPHLLAVGRLSREKGFDVLLHSMAEVRRRFLCADLLIAGAGAEEQALKELRRELGLEDAVRFAGHLERPQKYFCGATLFVLPSRHEGLPNALLEAAACGLPIVATPACGGVAELLRDRPGTWLANGISHDALTAALLTALRTLGPGERFSHSFIEQFRIEHSVLAYEKLMDEALRARRE